MYTYISKANLKLITGSCLSLLLSRVYYHMRNNKGMEWTTDWNSIYVNFMTVVQYSLLLFSATYEDVWGLQLNITLSVICFSLKLLAPSRPVSCSTNQCFFPFPWFVFNNVGTSSTVMDYMIFFMESVRSCEMGFGVQCMCGHSFETPPLQNCQKLNSFQLSMCLLTYKHGFVDVSGRHLDINEPQCSGPSYAWSLEFIRYTWHWDENHSEFGTWCVICNKVQSHSVAKQV